MAIRQLENFDFELSGKLLNVPPATNPNDPVVKSQLDAAVAALTGVSVLLPTAIDCSTNPDYPASTPGQSYRVNVAGLIGGASGQSVSVGDTIVCVNPAGSTGGTEAAVGADFEIWNGNLEEATELVSGVSRKNTQTEVNNGTLDSGHVTPLKLQTKLNTALAATTYGVTIGDTVNNVFTVTHNLNTTDPIVQFREANSPFGKVGAGWNFVNTNTIQVTFVSVLPLNSIRVTVKK